MELVTVLRIHARGKVEHTRQSAGRITLAVLQNHRGSPVPKDGIADNQSRVRTHEQRCGAHFDGYTKDGPLPVERQQASGGFQIGQGAAAAHARNVEHSQIAPQFKVFRQIGG